MLLYQGDEGVFVSGPQAFQECGLVNVLLANARDSVPLHHFVCDAASPKITNFPVTVPSAGGL
jgi:hypothetical protein